MMPAIQSPVLILLLLKNDLAAWFLEPGEALLRDQSIEGESGWFSCGDKPERLMQGMMDLRERLSDELSKAPLLELIYDQASQAVLEKALPKLSGFLHHSQWQIQRWEPLAERSGLAGNAVQRPALDFIAQNVWPLLLAADDQSQRQHLQDATQREHLHLSDQLQAERQQLEKDNAKLKAQYNALKRIDGEQLITYLPALFPRVFTVLGGQDLALLTGRPEPYVLPNPYPEPSEETRFILQRDFRALPPELQRQIVAFVARTPQRQHLQPRPEMRELVAELERG